MSVKIRLSRIGKKHVPFHRVIVVDSRKKRDGAYLDNLGTYDALKSQVITFNEALYNEWLNKGAQPSESAHKVYKQFKKIGLEAPAKQKKVTKPKKEKEVVEEIEVKAEKVETKEVVPKKEEAPIIEAVEVKEKTASETQPTKSETK